MKRAIIPAGLVWIASLCAGCSTASGKAAALMFEDMKPLEPEARAVRAQAGELPLAKPGVPPLTPPLRPLALPPGTLPSGTSPPSAPSAFPPLTPMGPTGLGAPLTPMPAPGPALPPPLTSELPPYRSELPPLRPELPPPTSGITTTSLRSEAERRATVRAHVNGRPIFDYEVMNHMSQRARPVKSEKDLVDLYNSSLDELIDQEVVYQEAARRLEKNNPKAWAKLKEAAEAETEKRVQLILSKVKDVSAKELKEQIPVLKKFMERDLIYNEYLRSNIFPKLKSVIGPREVREYYETHLKDFVRPESVEWQDVFLAIGPKYRTVADARRAADELLAQVRTPGDFAKLSAYDDGDAKFNGGKGVGRRRGEIRPAEIEEHLFNMRDGEIGPVVELSTGVHIFRLVQRDSGGVTPLNDAVQAQIQRKLQERFFDREAKSVIRTLRARADIEKIAGN